MPEPGTIAVDLTCAESGQSPRAGETWRILFADKAAREAVIYCPECAELDVRITGVARQGKNRPLRDVPARVSRT